jgi:curved DNA-binding protein CbpA
VNQTETVDKTCYELLQVHPAAPLELVTAAYWRLVGIAQAKRGSDPLSETLLHQLNRAYRTLADPGQRAFYDAALGLSEQAPAPTIPARKQSLLGRALQRDSGIPQFDYYEVLRVTPDVDPSILAEAYPTIRGYYLRLINTGQANDDLIDALDEAYSVVADPRRRRIYDDERERWLQQRQLADRAPEGRRNGHSGGVPPLPGPLVRSANSPGTDAVPPAESHEPVGIDSPPQSTSAQPIAEPPPPPVTERVINDPLLGRRSIPDAIGPETHGEIPASEPRKAKKGVPEKMLAAAAMPAEAMGVEPETQVEAVLQEQAVPDLATADSPPAPDATLPVEPDPEPLPTETVAASMGPLVVPEKTTVDTDGPSLAEPTVSQNDGGPEFPAATQTFSFAQIDEVKEDQAIEEPVDDLPVASAAADLAHDELRLNEVTETESEAPHAEKPSLEQAEPAEHVSAEEQTLLARLSSNTAAQPKTPWPGIHLLLKGPNGRSAHRLERFPATIGSDKDCDVVLPELEPVQLRVIYRGGMFVVSNLGVTDDSAKAWMVLQSGDEFSLGPYELRFAADNN